MSAIRARIVPAAMLLAVVCLLSAAQVGAEVLEGRVVGVTDGDTIKVLTADNTEARIRLAAIDAPERAQPFGDAAKRQLSSLVFGRPVEVHWQKRDRYRRIVGAVWVSGVDVGLEQVRSGLAWHYKQYAAEQSPEERARYAEAENAARSGQIGLWADGDPVPPWDWRRR